MPLGLIIGSHEIVETLAIVTHLEAQMNALQTAISILTTDLTKLSAAVTVAQSSQFSTADVQNVQAIDDKVNALVSILTPAPEPTPAPAPTVS
jgi:hypothetical protein